MITKVILPKADANMAEGTVAKWLINEGEKIRKGASLVEIVTDKAVFELDAPRTGILVKIVAPEQSVIPPGYIMAFIGNKNDKIPDYEEKNRKLMKKFLEKQAVANQKKEQNKNSGNDPEKTGAKEKTRATPAARRLGRQYHISLDVVKEMFKTDIVNEKMVTEYLEKCK